MYITITSQFGSHKFVFFLFLLVPQLHLWGSPFWVSFLCMWPFFNPTLEVVTFHLRGWCMLGVFLLQAFTFLGHERQDLWVCAMECMCAQTRPQFSVHTLIGKSFRGMESEPMVTPRGKSPLLEKFFPEEDWTHNAAQSRTVSSRHYQRAIPAQFVLI